MWINLDEYLYDKMKNSGRRENFFFFFNIHLGYSLYFTVGCLCSRRENYDSRAWWISALKIFFMPSHSDCLGINKTESGDLNTELVCYSNGQKEIECQMVQYSKAIWIPDSPTIWILDKWTPFCFLCTGPVFKWLA